MNNSTDHILDSSRDFALYTVKSRGIPSLSDGLKDSQRKALYLIKNHPSEIKTVSLAGQMLSSLLYLHGDASASETISMLAAPFCNNVPLLHGIGAFGTKVGQKDWGAPRYTYVKQSQYTKELIYTDFDIIPMKENYDGSVMEPVHFLPLIPVVLLNGVSGIAVGWSTDILPHDINDIINATLDAIDGKKVKELRPHYDYLDIVPKHLEGMSWSFEGKVQIDANIVYVKELPPDLTLEKFKARLNKMEDDGLIQSYVDSSTSVIDIAIRFKRGTIDKWDQNKVVDFLKLRSKQTSRLVVLNWDSTSIKQYDSTSQLITDFVNWRLDWYVTRYNKKRNDVILELNWFLAIKACYDGNLPEFLPKANNKTDIIEKIKLLCKKIDIDDSIYERLASLPSYRWAKDHIKEVDDKIIDLGDQIKKYDVILSDPKKRRDIYRKEVENLKNLPKVVRSVTKKGKKK